MLSGSPHGSVMSCQSLTTARPYAEDSPHCAPFHRSVRFSSESRSSVRSRRDEKKDGSGSVSMTALSLSMSQSGSTMSQSAPPPSILDCDDMPPPPLAEACRFPRLEECAHFHYERVNLGSIHIEVTQGNVDDAHCVDDGGRDEGWICLKIKTHLNNSTDVSLDSRQLNASWTEASDVSEWTLTRNAQNFLQLDDMLHRCIYDRKVSGLVNLAEEITASLLEDKEAYDRLISHYVHHFSIIADDSINCGPVLNWLQMDNKGHKLLVANEDCNSINTPAVAAAYSVRKYVSQARDEISFEVGDMISIIDMPGPQESLWWRGKRGFRVGFFPHNCVAVIGDKVPRHMAQPPPIVGSVAVNQIKPVLRKHGKLISLFRSFILSRPSRRSLKQQGILKERVFGCDLGEHLLNCGRDVPLVLVECSRVIEERGAVDGIYRLSGGSGLTQRLRAEFDSGSAPDLTSAPVVRDPHALASLLKMYFRELPNPLCTYQLYDSFVLSVQAEESTRLERMRETVVKLPPPHYRTLSYLMRHLRRVSLLGHATGMTARNMAIVWAPNLLRSPSIQHALQGVAVQAVITEFLICYAEELFAFEQDEGPRTDSDRIDPTVELRGTSFSGRPKSLPLNPPARLLSLEEARRRGKHTSIHPDAIPVSGTIAAAAAVELRPSTHLTPKYIEVGSGPNNLPQYHTVLELPAPGTKRGLKRSPSGWRGLFSRSKQQRQRTNTREIVVDVPITPVLDTPMCVTGLRPVKSCESLQSENDTLPPLTARCSAPLKHHTRSASCDSYFETWQAELNDMRLRLSPQEADTHMFSEEVDTNVAVMNGSVCSSPVASDICSVEPSPNKNLRVDINAANEYERKRNIIEEQLPQIGYIDACESPRAKSNVERRTSTTLNADSSKSVERNVDSSKSVERNVDSSKYSAEKRASDIRASSPRDDVPKRLCKDRDSPKSSMTDFQISLINVKLRDRGSPRKAKHSNRYSNLQNLNIDDKNTRLSWHGKDGHSTLIKINWPENTSATNLTNSTPLTPISLAYDPLETDSDLSDNKQTIKVTQNCDCHDKCLKCELNETDFGIKADFKIGQPVTRDGSTDNIDSLDLTPPQSDVSYANVNRDSIVSNGSRYENLVDDVTAYEDIVIADDNVTHNVTTDENGKSLDVSADMTNSHESSSFSHESNTKTDDYETFNFARANYTNLSNSTTPISPKSPLKSTISITFRSPTKSRSDFDEFDSLDKNLAIVEEASVPVLDASLPTQQACQPNDLIILEKPDIDVYNQVKFFKQSIEEVNALVTPNESRHYENIPFPNERRKLSNDYENVDLNTLKIDENDDCNAGNDDCKNLNVKELATRFESPTEHKSFPSKSKKDLSLKLDKGSMENAFVQEFGAKVTPTEKTSDFDDKLSRERIEKYKEERRMFLREKYSSQSFRSNPEHLTRIKIKKDSPESSDGKFERRNSVDLGQRMRFSLAKSSSELDELCGEAADVAGERKDKMSPSYNIRDMTALFEQKSSSTSNN